jgi:hypothetical protein
MGQFFNGDLLRFAKQSSFAYKLPIKIVPSQNKEMNRKTSFLMFLTLPLRAGN